jgi:hypothetical protein
LPLHLGWGTQLTLVMRMLVTCGLAAAFVAGFVLAGAVAPAPPAVTAPPDEEAPPALVAAAFTAAPARPASEHDSATTAAAKRLLKRSLDRLWAALIAKTIPSMTGESICPVGGVRG